MTDPVEETYFNTDYRNSTIYAGLLLMPALMSIGWPLYYIQAAIKGVGTGKAFRDSWNDFTQYALSCAFFG